METNRQFKAPMKMSTLNNRRSNVVTSQSDSTKHMYSINQHGQQYKDEVGTNGIQII